MDKESHTDKILRKQGVNPTDHSTEELDNNLVVNFRKFSLAGKILENKP